MPAVFDQTTVEIEAKADRTYDFRVSGSVLKFDGFLKAVLRQARRQPKTTILPTTSQAPVDRRL